MFRGRPPLNFDLLMEILATVPYAAPASVRVLADDFRMAVGEMRTMLRKLSGFGVSMSDGETGCRVVIPRRFQDDVTARVEEYWAKVHERADLVKEQLARMN